MPLPADSAPPGLCEQPPETWWRIACQALSRLMAELRTVGGVPAAIAVDSTSGSVVLTDADGKPLRPAVLYADRRGREEAAIANERGAEVLARLGYRFNTSSALPKVLWVQGHEPELFGKVRRIMSPADWLTGKLTGRFDLSDHTNVLKTGYDLLADRWPDYFASLGLDRALFPKVVPTGCVAGPVQRIAAQESGLPVDLPVALGGTDGTAAFFGSGARRPGQYAVSLGTTLVLKGIASGPVLDRLGRVYSHRHPMGYWLPGGASNVGGECLERGFPNADLAELDRQACERLPCPVLAYPLARPGERFPFHCPDAQAFFEPAPSDEADRYAACLQGVAFVEKWGCEVLEELAGALPAGAGEIFSTGGGSRSDVWTQLRADVSGRPILRPAEAGSALGAAVLAASQTLFANVEQAAESIVRISARFDPDPRRHAAYQDAYAAFRSLCREKGYG